MGTTEATTNGDASTSGATPRSTSNSAQAADRERGAGSWPTRAGLAAFFSLAAATFLLATRVPVYTDEVGWKLIQDRYGYDGGKTTSPLPACSVTEFDVPALLKPYRLFDTAVYQDISGPLAIRRIGLGLAAAWAVLAWMLLRKALRGAASGPLLAVLVVAFSTLGLMPFLLVLNRPEQVLLVGITLFSIPVLAGVRSRRRPLGADVGLALLLTVFGGYFFVAHPRAVFALPLVLVFLDHVFERRAVAIGAGLAAVLFCGVSLADWGLRSRCDDPAIAKILAAESILSSAAQGQLGDYLAFSFVQLLTDPARVLYLSPLRMDLRSTSSLVPAATTALASACGVLVQGLLTILVAAGAASFAALLSRACRSRSMSRPEAMLLALWAFYGASVLARVTRLTYEAALMEPVMVIASLGSLWVARDLLEQRFSAEGLRRAAAMGFAALVATSVFSQVALVVNYLPYATGSWSVPGYLEGQRFSVSSAGYEGLRPRIVETAALCGIDAATHPHHLILDELTVFAMEAARQPFLATYIDEGAWGHDIGDHRALLTRIGSEGMVVGCHRVPSQLQAAAVRNAEFCCLPAFRP